MSAWTQTKVKLYEVSMSSPSPLPAWTNLSNVPILPSVHRQPGKTLQDELTRGDSQRGTECLRVRVCVWARLSVYMRLCDVLSIKRVVICKSALLWAGGVKLGKQGEKRGEGREGKGQTDRQIDSMWMAGMSVKEREERETECESGLYYITGFFSIISEQEDRLTWTYTWQHIKYICM